MEGTPLFVDLLEILSLVTTVASPHFAARRQAFTDFFAFSDLHRATSRHS